MQTNSIFIDTSIFYKENFSFGKHKLQEISRLCFENIINLILTDVTIKEVEKKMSELVEEAIRAHNKFMKEGKILRNIEQPKYILKFEGLSSQEANMALLSNLANFTSLARAVISVDTISPSEVFERYFEKSPPFGSEGKKHEFPDAFVLNALEKWCKESASKIYVVACDRDFEEYCKQSPNLIYISSLSEVLDIVSKSDEYAYNRFHAILDGKTEDLAKLIKKEIEDCWFWLEDEEGEVMEIEITDITLGEYFITARKDNTFDVSVKVDVNLSAEVEYGDPTTASYDSEEGRLIYWEKIHSTLERQKVLEIPCTIECDINRPDTFQVKEIDLSRNYDLSVAVHDDEYH